MSDYIKRKDAIKALEGWKISGEMILATVPSADVVEVVRCKDCKWWKPFNDKMGDCGYDMKHKDQYCSNGERADE